MVTKLEIAKKAGVSITCVCQVLNQTPNARISGETRRRVFEFAEKLGYSPASKCREPNSVAAIAYVTCGGFSPWHITVLRNLHLHAKRDERHILFLETSDQVSEIRQTVRMLSAAKPLGIILDGLIPDMLVTQLESLGIPFVISGTTSYAYDPEYFDRVNTCTMDIEWTVIQLVQWIAKQGAKSIALVIGSRNILTWKLILEAYKKSIVQLELEYNLSLIQIGEEENGAELVSRYDHLGIEYSGIIFGNPVLASTALPYFQAQNRTGRPPIYPAIFSALDCVGPTLRHITACGPMIKDFTQSLYGLICAEINYPAQRKRHLITPSSFKEGHFTL